MKNRTKKSVSLKSGTATFFKVIKYLRYYRIHFAISILFSAISVALTLYVPILIGQAIDLAIGKDDVDIAGIADILLRIFVSVIIASLLQ